MNKIFCFKILIYLLYINYYKTYAPTKKFSCSSLNSTTNKSFQWDISSCKWFSVYNYYKFIFKIHNNLIERDVKSYRIYKFLKSNDQKLD